MSPRSTQNEGALGLKGEFKGIKDASLRYEE